MKCYVCGNETASPYAGDFVAARQTHHVGFTSVAGTQFKRETWTYKNPRPVSVAFCEECFRAILRRNNKIAAAIMIPALLLITLFFLFLASVAPQKDRWFVPVIHTFVGLIWIALLGRVAFEVITGHRGPRVPPPPAIIQSVIRKYVAKRMRASGFYNVVLTLEEWAEIEKHHTESR